MLRYLTAYVCTAAILFPVDLVWLTVIARGFYSDNLRPLLAERPNIAAGVAFYVLYSIGLVIFAVSPALAEGSFRKAALLGGLFGFFAYMTYDLTNVATLAGFPWIVAIVDVAWGAFVSALASAGGFLLARFVLARLGA